MTDNSTAPTQQQYPQPPYAAPQSPPPHFAYPAAPASYGFGPVDGNPVGVIALFAAVTGLVFATIGGFITGGGFIFGWVMLTAGFVTGVIAVCLRGRRKWQGITAIAVSAVGTMLGFLVFFAILSASIAVS